MNMNVVKQVKPLALGKLKVSTQYSVLKGRRAVPVDHQWTINLIYYRGLFGYPAEVNY